MSLHRGERAVAGGPPLLESIRERFQPARIRDPEANDRDRRLVVVLLEEHPLQYLCPLVAVAREEVRSLTEVPQNRARLRQGTSVVEHEGRDAKRRVEATEEVGPVRPVDD